MNLRITLTFLLMAFVLVGMNAQVIWGGPGDPNGEFAGGLNDWTTMGLSSHVPDSASNAVWFHTPDGLSNGSLFGDTPIASESVGNGAAIFDSDFLDNGGNIEFDDAGNVIASSVGGGPAPCFEPGGFSGDGHSGILTSPTIDCSDQPTVVLRFYSYFRSFSDTMYVDVSNDDGVTFTSFEVNNDNDLGSIPDNIVNLNITEVAANSPTVRIQFRWTGSYYFWMVDDVALLSLPPNNLAIDEITTFYSPASAVQPACSFDEDLILFATEISNIGSDTIANLVYRAIVINNDTGDEVYRDSLVFGKLAPGVQDSSISIVDLWDPEILDQGVYRIIHEVFNTENGDDFDPSNNRVDQFFEISDMTFSKDITADGSYGWWNNGGFNAYGVFYTLGSDCMENYTIASVDYSVGRVSGDDEPLEGREMQFWLWEMNSASINDFDFTADYIESTQTISHPSMTFLAFAPDMIDSDDTGEIFSSDAPFLNVDGDPLTPILQPGTKYGLFAHWGINGTTSPLHLMNNENSANDFVFYVEEDGRFYTGFSNNLTCPILRMQLELFSSVDDQPLADEAFKVYPNPATDLVNLELNLETASNATVTIADITGRVIKYQNLSSVQNEMISINVANYVSGTYLARVATEEGTKTIKFVVE